MSDSTTPTQTTVHQTVGVDDKEALGPEQVDKQRIDRAWGAAHSAEAPSEAASPRLKLAGGCE
jgi:hypothetical protein